MLPWVSMTSSRFHRYACWHQEVSNVEPGHGSFASLPYTGSVHADSRVRPNRYCVPSGVVTFQYSLSLSPLSTPPITFSTREPSSFLGRHRLSATWISAEEWAPSDSVALSPAQHSSPVFCASIVVSSWQDRYSRSTKPGPMSQPSPIQEGWLLVAAVWPS